MTSRPNTTMTRVVPDDDGARITVVLEDLAGDDGRPLGTAVVELPPGRAGVLVAVTGDSAAVTGRLLRGTADHLRALGRLRLSTSCAVTDGAPLEVYAAAGFRRVREHGGRIDLVLEL